MAKKRCDGIAKADPRPYYGVFLFTDGTWHYHFGDYDRAVAVQEGNDERESKDLRAKDVKVETFPMDKNINEAIRTRLEELNAPPPCVKGQTVYISVLPKRNITGSMDDCSPSPFATREGAQADCDNLNKGRMPDNRFVVREMKLG